MQPKTDVKFDRETFDRLKRTVLDVSAAARGRVEDAGHCTAVPREVGLQLTHRCNLRCMHCFQWDQGGFFRDFDAETQAAELSPAVVERLLQATKAANSRFYLWGGEPFVHREWRTVAGLFERDPRRIVLSTNGLLLEHEMESVLRLGSELAVLVSLDGFRDACDAIRGRGIHGRILRNLTTLLSLKKSGEFKGQVTINCVLTDGNVPTMYDFMSFCETLGGVDTVYFSVPYYICERTAGQMDAYYERELSWLPMRTNSGKPSWHAYKHHLSGASAAVFCEQTDLLRRKTWECRIRIQPPLEKRGVRSFLQGTTPPAQGRTSCFAVSLRLDVLADGRVGTCKLFPELAIGNLNEDDPIQLWRSEEYQRFRRTIAKGLMPICSQCILLYLYGR